MRWEQVPGSARDIGVGPDGEVWVIGQDQGIYRRHGSDRDEAEGAAAPVGTTGYRRSGSTMRESTVPREETGDG
jgi:hypothetical protein